MSNPFIKIKEIIINNELYQKKKIQLIDDGKFIYHPITYLHSPNNQSKCNKDITKGKSN